MTADRASLSDETINGLRTVKGQVKVHGRPHEVPITADLLLASREAHWAYAKKKLNVYWRLREGKKKRVKQQAEKLEKSRKKLAEKEEQLRKSEGK